MHDIMWYVHVCVCDEGMWHVICAYHIFIKDMMCAYHMCDEGMWYA